MKIAYIGTYPPRQCGIGTFTRNKFMAMMSNKIGAYEHHEGMVIAISDNNNVYDYPEEVQFTIQHDKQDDYMEAADFINRSGADVCILEHEYGIFGGENGVYVLPLLHRLKIPVIAVFHTVLKKPSHNEKAILTAIFNMAAKTVVMTHKAVEFLEDSYGIPGRQVEVIEHGVPDLKFDAEVCKKEFDLANKKILLTFGLISRNKGIETVIKALPAVVAKHPEIVYVVLGKTHPAVVRHSGEEYRDYLLQLVKELHLEDHVLFMNEFVNEEKLFKYLTAADIYVTPYLNEAQITSGTLSYAVGAGCAVVSTPYWHAAELLNHVGGRLFEINNYKQLSSVFMDMLDHPVVMNEMRNRAYAYGNKVTWPKVGERYIKLAQSLTEQPVWKTRKKSVPDMRSLPTLSLDHIRRMTDNTGIIQHAKYGIPNFKEGYCLDDNSRALLSVLMVYNQQKHFLSIELLRVYLGYIYYMQNDDGSFHNFLSYNRSFLDEKGSEDSFGRTIWALGYLLNSPPNNPYYHLAKEMFFKAVPHFKELRSLRGIANTLIGVSYFLQSSPGDAHMTEISNELSGKLIQQYAIHRSDQWKWFEPVLTYDNAILPLSLLHAASVQNDEAIRKTAIESMHFLSDITLKNGYLSIVGNNNWFTMNGKQSVFAQQPLDVMAMILMFQQAFDLTKNKKYLDHLHSCFMWFLGENDLGMNLYDHESKGCCDGLECYGVNRNQGAESTLAYLISHLSYLETFEETETYVANNKDFAMKSSDSISLTIANANVL